MKNLDDKDEVIGIDPNQVNHQDEFDEFEKILNLKDVLLAQEINLQAPKVLIDTSLIIDVLLERNSIFLKDAMKIIKMVFSQDINGYIVETGLRDIWDISKKLKGKKEANYLIIKLLNSFNVCNLDREIINNSSDYFLNSFETGIQIECAKSNRLDAIITLREKDFLGCGWESFFSPAQFLAFYESLKSSEKKFQEQLKSLTARENLNNLLKKSEKEEKLSLFEGWKIKHFYILSSRNKLSEAVIALSNSELVAEKDDQVYVFRAWDCGSVTALFKALDQAITSLNSCLEYSLDSIELSQLEKGVESSVFAVVVLNVGNHKIRTSYTHKDIIKACFYAYIKAIRCIYDTQNCNEHKFSSISRMPVQKNNLIHLYKSGRRDFSQMNLREIDLVEKNLSGVNLSNSDLSLSNLQNINLSDSNLEQVLFKKTNLFHASLNNSVLYKANLAQAKLNKTDLNQANLSNTDLTEANLDNATLVNSNLTSAIITKGILSEANLTGAILSRAILIEGDLKKATLIDADLTGANLTNANLSSADLTGANLTNANLSSADLTGVDLTTTKINGANLSEVNLTQANLKELDLNQTVFCQPKITDAKMPEVKIEIYGTKRLERIMSLLNQLNPFSEHEILAVSSGKLHSWWNSDVGKRFSQTNKKLVDQGFVVKRVFIVTQDNFPDEIIQKQKDDGVQVRYLLEDLAGNLDDDLRKTNLLICNNLSVPENSFTTKMVMNEEQEEETGYISYKKQDRKNNELYFEDIWSLAQSVPSITAKKFIDLAQEENSQTAKAELSFVAREWLNKEIHCADDEWRKGNYECALQKHYLITKQVFTDSSFAVDNLSSSKVLIKALSCYNKLEAFADVNYLSSFALKYVQDRRSKREIYHYKAGAFHELYYHTNNSNSLKEAICYYQKAVEEDSNDSVLLWNVFDLYVEAQKKENEPRKYIKKMKLAWKNFLQNIKHFQSNFEQYKDKIFDDRDRILRENQNNKWLNKNLRYLNLYFHLEKKIDE